MFSSHCYVTMSFSLENAGSTYQRCIIECFGDLIARVVEAYVDDNAVETTRSEGLPADLGLSFERLKANDIKLNPKKWG